MNSSIMAWFVFKEAEIQTKFDAIEKKIDSLPRYRIGDHLYCSKALGVCDQIEWSITFQTWCYRVTGKRPYWIYQNDPTLYCTRLYGAHGVNERRPRRPLPLPPCILPDPIPIME